MPRNPWLFGAAALTLIVTAGPALAHIQLTCPPARYAYNATGIKMGPCGASGGTKSNAVTHLTAGQSLMVTFTETVYHPGFFRISVDTSGMEKFPAISSTPMNPVMAPVVADNIFPHTSGSSNAKRMFMVTIPNTPCTKCQLQLTQFMSDNPNSGYYECADIVIDDAATGTPYVCGGGGMSGGGGRMGGGGRQGGSAGATGNGGAPASGSGGASATGSGGAGGSGPGGAPSTASGGSEGSASGGANGSGSGGIMSASGGHASGGSSSGGSASGGSASGGSASGGSASGGSASGGATASGSGGTKGPGGDDGAGGCAYASGAPVTDLALAVALASWALALARRRRARSRA